MGAIPRAVGVQRTNANPRAETTRPYPQHPRVIRWTSTNPRTASVQWIGSNPRAIDVQQIDVSPRVVAMQQTDVCPRDVGTPRIDANQGILSAKWMVVYPRARSNRQSPIRTRECIEDLNFREEVLTIIRGPHKAGNGRHACNKYTKEVKHPPQVLVHKVNVCFTNNTQ